MLLHKDAVDYYREQAQKAKEMMDADGSVCELRDSDFGQRHLPDLEGHLMNIQEHMNGDDSFLKLMDGWMKKIQKASLGNLNPDHLKIQRNIKAVWKDYDRKGKLFKTIQNVKQCLEHEDCESKKNELKHRLWELDKNLAELEQNSRKVVDFYGKYSKAIIKEFETFKTQQDNEFKQCAKSWFIYPDQLTGDVE